MLRKSCALALGLALLAGCNGNEDVTDEVASPSEGARIENQNPTTPDVDVPSTPTDEAADRPGNPDARPGGAELTPLPQEPVGGSNVASPAPAAGETADVNAAPAPLGGNAGEKTLEDADEAAKSGGAEMPNP